MDKKVLQTYAVWAKENLEKQVEVSLKTLGINSDDDIRSSKVIGDYTVIDGDPNSYPQTLHAKRTAIINLIKEDSYQAVIEEFAYTWFNRFVALRFMEIHDFLPHGFRVLSSKDGSVEPEIIKNLAFVKDELKLDLGLCEKLKSMGIEELYRYVLFRQCKALSGIFPMLFDEDSDCLELLLPKTLLLGDTVLTKLVDLGDEPFWEDVEIIGWMYQFYISAKKDEVNRAKKTITKDTLPAVTQLFTPDWIVRYMSENSVGRLWLESYPESSLRSAMKYYVEDPEQPEEVQRKIDVIKYNNVKPEDIKIIEPCCGSGHILVYVFDLLYKMYEEKGYQNREIPTLILKNNLYGLDVDKRASQLAAFSLVMKARSVNPRFFNEKYYVKPQVYEIWDSRALYNIGYKRLMEETKVFTSAAIGDIECIAELFKNAKTIGSLLKVKEFNWHRLDETIDALENKVVYNIFNQSLYNVGLRVIKKLVMQAKILSRKYDVMITNPPYIGISSMEDSVRQYANDYYPNSKADMFAMFMETEFVKPKGFLAMINMHSWMFLSSFEKLRKKIIDTQEIVTMAHLGAHAFETIGGEVVQTTAFVIRNVKLESKGVYFRLVNSKDKEKTYRDSVGQVEMRFTANISNFFKIPGSPIVYWISNKIAEIFEVNPQLKTIAEPKQGLATTDNNRFIRFWAEVSILNIGFNYTLEAAKKSGIKWFPLNKGGEYRKWYGNNDYIINYQNDGYEIKNSVLKKYEYLKTPDFVVKNQSYYFKENGTWSAISNGAISVRYSPEGYIISNAGMAIYSREYLKYIIAFINSKCVSEKLIRVINQTINFNAGDIEKLPFQIVFNRQQNINNICSECINISKKDWDSFETSWDFKKHPLI